MSLSALTRAAARTSDLHVAEIEPLPSPAELLDQLPADDTALRRVARSREAVRAALLGTDDRLLVIVGPCSIHDTEAGLEYARRLATVAQRLDDRLLVVMRTYFEKPRTTIGWKGLVNDPHLDGSHDIATGLHRAREFLRDVVDLGLPTATEFLEPISPQYLADLISWGAIGARTAESQIHRQLASGLSMPIGFKNGTDGSLDVALDGCTAAGSAQSFLGIDPQGRAALVRTSGNPDTHVILRGSSSGPNYSAAHVQAAAERLRAAGMPARVMVDASHGNSGKDHRRQAVVAHEIAEQVAAERAAGAPVLAGVMLESFLVGGAQRLDPRPGHPALTYGQSVTDACLGWDTTVEVLEHLAAAVTR
ncbi:3-deoxy-7-phosphoheptulonate synthase [Pseudactinotalea suaedae]|uniref:3-deoxy-7-phosphoheptulonate synthase n=1 Tax=Pseudactinotalea suaedae TaxID=1524924 RepID=UPI0012E2282D|nr:3-deoxy-7-phosphoheptulonate synthase [Pseudactinotalea suaedae]